MRNQTLSTVFAVTLTLAGRAGALANDVDLATRMDREIDRALTERRIVGTVVIVVEDGSVAYHRAAGYADREGQRTMREDEIFRLASLSKPIVSAAAMALIERGRLTLDDPITKWLPSFQPKGSDGDIPVIKIRDLLTHTAGLSYSFLEPEDGPYGRAGVSDGLGQPGLSMEEELNRITAAGLAYEPGSKWRYSVAIDVLGAIISKVAGESLPEAVKHLVTGPLGMSETGFTTAIKDRLAVPYADGKPEPIRMSDPQHVPFRNLTGVTYSPSRIFDPTSFPSGGAGMVGTAKDFVRFLEAIRQSGGNILKPATTELMMTNQIGSIEVTNQPGWGFGFGAAVLEEPETARSPQSQGSWAWGGAYGSSFFIDPKRRLTVVALTNTALEGMFGAFPKDIRNAVYGTPTK